MAQENIGYDRVPPQDVDAERALLGAMVYGDGNREYIKLAIDVGVIPEIFYKEHHQVICTAIFNLYDKNIGVDLLTVAKELGEMEWLDKIDVRYLDELIDSTPNAANLTYYAEIVQEEALRRAIIQRCCDLYVAAFDSDADELPSKIKLHQESISNISELYNHANNKKYGWTAKEIMAMDIPKPVWLVRNYVPEGLTLLAGAPKIGKSWLTLQLAAGVASTQGYFLGIEPVENHGNVLYLALEDSMSRIQSRIGTVCPDGNYSDRLEFWEDCPRLAQGGLVKIEGWIKNQPEPRLVIIDVLEKVRAVPDKYKTAYTQDYDELSLLKNLCKKYSISIVLVDHKRKAEADDIMNTIHGSVGKQGAPDGLLIITRPRSERIGTLSRTGKDFEQEDDMAIEFDIEQHGGWRLIGDAQSHLMTEQRQKIIKLLEDTNEPMTPKQMADELVANPATIRGALRRMVIEEVIKQFGRGQYIINQNKKENK
jgi:hypothetical protein